MDSRKLLERSRNGDATAISELLQRHLPGLRAFIRLRMGRDLRAKESGSDLAQSVCLELFRLMDDFEYRGEQSFRAWLYTAALNKIRQRARYHEAEMRDSKREVAQASERGDDKQILQCYASFCTPSRHAMGREALERVESAFDNMPEDYREVITLERIVGLSCPEIAEMMGRTKGAVRVLLSRAMIRLATLVDRMNQANG